MTEFSRLKIVLAAYGVPGIMAIEYLFSLKILPMQISLLTHDSDDRNAPLLYFTGAHKIDTVFFDAKSENAFQWITHKQPDVMFSLHYRQRIPNRILEIPAYGCVNLHPSLLPRYRGCCSVPWAIINGEQVTGYTYHYMVEQFDKGNIILQKEVPVDNSETAFSLFHKLIMKGMNSFSEVLERVIKHRDIGILQQQGGSYYPRRLPFDGNIDISWDKSKVERFIRAMYFPPFKGAIVRIAGKEYEVCSIDEYRTIVQKNQREKDYDSTQ